MQFSKKMVAEPERLDSINYVTPTSGNPRGIHAISDDHARDASERFDLKTYVEITAEGLQYLALRKRFSGDPS